MAPDRVGIAAARRPAGYGLRVTVLEAGPAITDPPGSHLRNQARFQQDPDAFFGAVERHLEPVADLAAGDPLPGAADSALLGGQGVLWTNNCPCAAGFEPWDALTPEQWERAYAAAEDLLQVVPDPAAASSTGRRVGDRLQSALTEQGRSIRGLPLAGHVVPDGGIRFNAPWDMLAAAAPAVRARIDVQPGVRVTRLDHRAGRVTAADVMGPRDRRDTIAAPVVLIAGGALANAAAPAPLGDPARCARPRHLVSCAAVRPGRARGRPLSAGDRGRRRAAAVGPAHDRLPLAPAGPARHLPAAGRRSRCQPPSPARVPGLPVGFSDHNAFVIADDG